MPTNQFLPQGPFGTTFWGGYWAPHPDIILLEVTGESFLDAEPQGYEAIKLTWTQVQLDFDRYLLVRNRYGPPDTPSDGIVVLFGYKDDNINEFIDGDLNPGFYYYSLFVGLNQ